MRAKLARIDVGEIVANGASTNRSLRFEDTFGELGCVRRIHFQNKECEPLGGLGADAGKFLELFDEAGDGFCDVHAQNRPGIFSPPVRLPS